jgi:DNA-binding NarL/FixJ family response regulator
MAEASQQMPPLQRFASNRLASGSALTKGGADNAVTILLADDHHVMRQGLRMLLEAQEGLRVIAEAGDGLETTQLAERLAPDVLIVDVMMPGLNGLEVTRHVCRCLPHTRVIILSMYSNEMYVLEALRHGAAGYVLKEASGTDLVRAVREVAAGRRYLSPPLSEPAIEAYLQKARNTPLNLYDTLTARERQVLQLVAEGRTNADIAAALFVSPRTVETHRLHLMRKLGLHTHRGYAGAMR